MKINRLELKTERQWRCATGFNQERFDKLLPYFEQCYLETYGSHLNSRQVESGLNYLTTVSKMTKNFSSLPYLVLNPV